MKSIFRIADMVGSLDTLGSPDGEKWYRAVPCPFYHGLFGRIRGAVAVIRGKAYPVLWPDLGELEAALYGEPRP